MHATLPLDGQAMPREEPAEPACEWRSGASARSAACARLALRRRDLFDALVAAALAAAIVEVAVSPDRSGPLAANVAARARLHRSARLAPPRAAAATAAVIAAILLMGLTLTSVEQLFVPFAAVLCGAYACGAQRRAYAGLALVVVALPPITATMDDRVAADYVFPSLLGDRRLARGPRRARPHAADGRTARGRGAARRGQREEQRSPRPRSAAGSRARCTTSSRTR